MKKCVLIVNLQMKELKEELNNYIYILEELYGYDFYTFPCGEPHFVHADWKKNEKILEEEVKKRIK